MKRYKSIFLVLFSILACQSEIDQNENTNGGAKPMSFYAGIEIPKDSILTKTILDGSPSDAYRNVLWEYQDEVYVTNGSQSAKFINTSQGTSEIALLEGKLAEGGNYFAAYPFDMVTESSSSSFTMNLPSKQTYYENGIGSDSFPMVAQCEDGVLNFKNICGVLVVQLLGEQTIKSIAFSGKDIHGNYLPVAGSGIVKTNYSDVPTLVMNNSSKTSVTLSSLTGVKLSPTTPTSFHIVLPVATYNSVELNIAAADGSIMILRSENELNIKRSMRTTAAVFDFVPTTICTDYIDEYGINHGPGVMIGETTWAPVNCGYHATDFKYGKLYQWGRKYGQGYSGNLYDGDWEQTYSDATVPTIEVGGVSVVTGNHESKSNVFYTEYKSGLWVYPPDNKLWNSGSESNPVKTEYDPCPEGWRVPTYAEFDVLMENYSSRTTDNNGQLGYWFSGAYSYTETVPQVFLPTAGTRYHDGNAYYRGSLGFYWSSYTNRDGNEAYCLRLGDSNMSLLSTARGFSVRCVQDNGELIPVSTITLDKSSLSLEVNDTDALSAAISPANANVQHAFWWSDNYSVAYVSQSGNVTAVSAGTAIIYAMAGVKVATCSVTVTESSSPSETIRYIDEYGVNHGSGVRIGKTIWAPVNCGYHKDDYKYGKLYQWGRKYGQGYDGLDATVPTIEEGGISVITGNHIDNVNVFYADSFYWGGPINDWLWNYGTEFNPVKTEYDPCPDGWRVPTRAELDELTNNHSFWTINEHGQSGYWFSGAYSYSETVPQVFFPAAGYRECDGHADARDDFGCYWSSNPSPRSILGSIRVYYYSQGSVNMGNQNRVCGQPVRCVKDYDKFIPVSTITLDESSISLEANDTRALTAAISPTNANVRSAIWWSDDYSVATVSEDGKVTAISAGTTVVSAIAGMQVATCEVTVTSLSQQKDYIDEYDINHGQGIKIGKTIWAPVNCGYHKDDYKYGKLYQWGRKYGQGYGGTDATVPTIEDGGISVITAQNESKSNLFFIGISQYDFDWLYPQDDKLWNSGSESKPLKTKYDPCPNGWRVPTKAELDELTNNHYWDSYEDACWFSGSESYSHWVPQVCFLSSGYRDYDGHAKHRDFGFKYWSSTTSGSSAYSIGYESGDVRTHGLSNRANGFSIRCVQEP